MNGILLLVAELDAPARLGSRIDLYRTLFLQSGEAIAVLDPQGIYLEQNTVHRALLGFFDEKLRGSTPRIYLRETALTGTFFGTRTRGEL